MLWALLDDVYPTYELEEIECMGSLSVKTTKRLSPLKSSSADKRGVRATVLFGVRCHCDLVGTHCGKLRLKMKIESVSLSSEVHECDKEWMWSEKCAKKMALESATRGYGLGEEILVQIAHNGLFPGEISKNKIRKRVCLKTLLSEQNFKLLFSFWFIP